MKQLPLGCLLGLCVLLPSVQGFFLGPVAVGAALGALAVKKGIIIGALLSSKRTRRQGYRGSRNFQYNRRNHYNTNSHVHYTRPSTYYYSSTQHRRYGKRETIELRNRYKREIEEGFDKDAWFLEMVEKDQDDCTKRLYCEMAAKNQEGPLQGTEADIAQAFGLGNTIDVSSSHAMFDMAAQAGKLMGKKRCEEFYRRCETPVPEILNMINTELEAFTKLEEDIMRDADPVAAVNSRTLSEKEELAKEINIDEKLIWT